MVESDNLRHTKVAPGNGSGAIPALGFGTLIPDPVATRTATKAALEAGFRQLDASERYRNETEVGEAIQEVFGPRTPAPAPPSAAQTPATDRSTAPRSPSSRRPTSPAAA